MIAIRTKRGIGGIAAAALVLSGGTLALTAPAQAAASDTPASTTQVSSIAENEDTYPGWHEGYDNDSPAYSLQSDGLHFGNGANSQVIDGLPSPQPVADGELEDLITAAEVDVTGGTAFFQVPVFFGDGESFTTLRPATGATAQNTGFAVDDDWISSSSIPEAGDGAVPANTPVRLGDLLDSLQAQGNVRVLAFGVLAESTDPAIVSSIVWDGVRYSFEPATGGGGTDAPAPPPAPEGTTDADSAASDDPDGTAKASSEETTVTAEGVGAVTVAQYPDNPAKPAPVEGDRTFFDVLVADDSDFSTLSITQCDLPKDAHSIVWFNGTRWLKASSVTYADGCVTVTITDSTAPSLSDLTGTVLAAGSLPVTRLAGADRIDTAVEVSQDRYPAEDSADAVVLARSDAYPDALAGAPLASMHEAPILLTNPAKLSAATQQEIERVLPDDATVYLLGGEGALPAKIAAKVRDAGFDTDRIGGEDRYGTAVEIADALGNPGTVLEVPGTDFADAVSAGPVASTDGGAILLTRDGTMPDTTAGYLADHPDVQRYAIGGVSANADPDAEAVFGADRYETATEVATTFFDDPATINLATGTAFPDALTAGPTVGVPIVLVPGDRSALPDATVSYLEDAAATVTRMNVLGGEAAVSDDIANAAQTLLQ